MICSVLLDCYKNTNTPWEYGKQGIKWFLIPLIKDIHFVSFINNYRVERTSFHLSFTTMCTVLSKYIIIHHALHIAKWYLFRFHVYCVKTHNYSSWTAYCIVVIFWISIHYLTVTKWMFFSVRKMTIYFTI